TSSSRMTGSPEPSSASDSKSKRKPQPVKEKDSDTQSVSGSTPSGDANKRKRKGAPRRKDERPDSNGLYKVGSFSAKDGQDTASSSGSGSRSSQPSPTNVTPRPPSRVIDEDYDEGAADALVVLSQYRSAEPSASGAHSPTLSSGSRHTATSPAHRRSVSSSNGPSPTSSGSNSLKRPLSPAPMEEMDTKRSRIDSLKRGGGSPSRYSPPSSRTQPHSPESRQHADIHTTYPSTPAVTGQLPPHPRPVGHMALPPIETLSPSSVPSPTDDRMVVDRRTPTPPSRGKLSEVMNPAVDSPSARPSGVSPPRSHEKKDSPS
ncbi:hypothetical protein SCLCIDRAFT_76262, partial [Scleroderma citrinum Foug A]